MNGSISCVKNKYIVEFDIATLEDNLLVESVTARLDLKENAIKATYVVVDANLYAKLKRDDIVLATWYFFDSSTRRWAECDDPNKEE